MKQPRAEWPAVHRAYYHATQQAFLEAHEFAFRYFGGVFCRLRYDNLKSAVKKILRGHHRREETERLIEFRSHWDSRPSSAIRREATRRAGWKAKWATSGAIIWCRCRAWRAWTS